MCSERILHRVPEIIRRGPLNLGVRMGFFENIRSFSKGQFRVNDVSRRGTVQAEGVASKQERAWCGERRQRGSGCCPQLGLPGLSSEACLPACLSVHCPIHPCVHPPDSPASHAPTHAAVCPPVHPSTHRHLHTQSLLQEPRGEGAPVETCTLATESRTGDVSEVWVHPAFRYPGWGAGQMWTLESVPV